MEFERGRSRVYGMIHKAARDMALQRLGEAEWASAAAACGMGDRHFISTEYFDDAVTMRLVAELADRMGAPLDETLEAFGRWWIRFVADSSFSRLLDMAGDDLPTFIGNLDRMHAGVTSSMPLARMSTFRLVESRPDCLIVAYGWGRPGLVAFTRGILHAVAERFGERLQIDHVEAPDGVLFSLRRSPAGLAPAQVG